MCCSEHANLLKETLEKQFEVVKERVSRNGTYMQGSHVLQFGSLSIDEEPIGDYLGDENTGQPKCSKCYIVILFQLVVIVKSVPSLHIQSYIICSLLPQTWQVLLQPPVTSVTVPASPFLPFVQVLFV